MVGWDSRAAVRVAVATGEDVTSAARALIIVQGARCFFISRAIWHQEHTLQKVEYKQSVSRSPYIEKHKQIFPS